MNYKVKQVMWRKDASDLTVMDYGTHQYNGVLRAPL